VLIPVAVHCSAGVVEGYTEQLADDAIDVQSLGGMPILGEGCQVAVNLPAGSLRARAVVAALDAAAQTFRLELKHLDENGRLLLARLVMAAEDPE
jgi:hypothetical protein